MDWLNLLRAPVFEDEDKTRIARLLNVIALAAAVLDVIVFLPTLITGALNLQTTVTDILILLVAIGVLVLIRRGYVGVASWLLCATLWGAITGPLAMSKDFSIVFFASYFSTTILFHMLLGRVVGIGSTVVSIAAGGIIFYWHVQRGAIPEAEVTGTLTNFTVIVANLIMGTVLLTMAMNSLNRALKQARTSNRDLRSAQAALEERVLAEESQRKHLQSAVQQYVSYMGNVARGNLAARLPLEGSAEQTDDPLTLLGHNLNDMVASLQRMTARIRDIATDLGSSAAEILAATTQQASGASEQSAAISQASTTIDEVHTIAQQTAQRAQGVADLAQQTAHISQAGQEAVADTIDGMGQVKQKVELIATEVLSLSDQAQAIGAIIASVNEIAAQSNMLALNAAVEAARAGEAGRGFAVVAQEVRSLAEQSREATGQVEELLNRIQRGVNTTVMATEEGMKETDGGVQLTGEAGRAIQNLAEGVTKSTQSAVQIAAAADQQQAGMEQIAQAMENIHQVTAQNVAGARQVEQAAGEVNDLVGQLRELVEQYQL